MTINFTTSNNANAFIMPAGGSEGTVNYGFKFLTSPYDLASLGLKATTNLEWLDARINEIRECWK